MYLRVRSSVPLPIRLRKIGVIQHDTMNDQRNQSTTTCSPEEEELAMPAICSLRCEAMPECSAQVRRQCMPSIAAALESGDS